MPKLFYHEDAPLLNNAVALAFPADVSCREGGTSHIPPFTL
jgi:hypothetical protein